MLINNNVRKTASLRRSREKIAAAGEEKLCKVSVDSAASFLLASLPPPHPLEK